MTELQNDQLVFRFPNVHADAVCRIGFHRTLRIPDDNRNYPLPPGLGRFPLRHVDDHLDQIPEAWDRHGGVFLPMYQAEAMWLQIVVYPMLAAKYEAWQQKRKEWAKYPAPCLSVRSVRADMGLAPGGLMRQKIYEDPHDFDAWDRSARSRCFVHILNSSSR